MDLYAARTLRDLSEVQHVADRQLVNVLGMVVDVANLSKVTHSSSSKPLKKQNVTFANSEAAVRIVLWEESVGLLQLYQTYNLNYTGTILQDVGVGC